MKPYEKYMMMMEEAVRDNRRRAKTERIVRQAYTKERETVRHTDKMVQLAPILFDVMVDESAKQEYYEELPRELPREIPRELPPSPRRYPKYLSRIQYKSYTVMYEYHLSYFLKRLTKQQITYYRPKILPSEYIKILSEAVQYCCTRYYHSNIHETIFYVYRKKGGKAYKYHSYLVEKLTMDILYIYLHENSKTKFKAANRHLWYNNLTQ